MKKPTRKAFTLVELLVVIAIIGILVALLLPAVLAAREAARRCQCRSNLRQVGLATMMYHDVNGHLPPPSTGATYEDRGGTLVLLLPYLEESSLYATYNFEESIAHADNLPVTTGTVPPYLCPSMGPPVGAAVGDGRPLGIGSYLISTRTHYNQRSCDPKQSTYLDGAFVCNDTTRGYGLALNDVIDGTSKTIFAGEINYAFEDQMPLSTTTGSGLAFAWAEGYWIKGWGHMGLEPTLSIDLFNNNTDWAGARSYRTFRSDHPGGVNFVKLDGSVQYLADGTDASLRRALVTRAGEEVVSGLE